MNVVTESKLLAKYPLIIWDNLSGRGTCNPQRLLFSVFKLGNKESKKLNKISKLKYWRFWIPRKSIFILEFLEW